MDGRESEHPTLSFVVRIWIEEPAAARSGAIWRGHITHVQSGDRRAVDTLGEVEGFIVCRLAEMSVRWRAIDRIRLLLTGAHR